MKPSSVDSPLLDARIVGFTATTDAARCRSFYEGKLGLKCVKEDQYNLLFESGVMLVRVQKAPELTLVQRTVLGWSVRDIESTVRRLTAAGVAIEKYTWIKQTPEGIAEFPDGSKVAWFKDPDGNILSVDQQPG